MALKLDLNELIALFNTKKLDTTFDPSIEQIQITLKISKREVPVIFNIISEGLVLQSIGYLPIQVPKKRLTDISRLLHILNKQLDIPGFGMDEKHGLVFFRVTVPCLKQTFEEDLIEIMLGATKLACDSFVTGIELIASGTVSLEKTLKEKDSDA